MTDKPKIKWKLNLFDLGLIAVVLLGIFVLYIILNIRTGKDITAVNLLFDDPYAYGISGDIHWVGRPVSMAFAIPPSSSTS